MKYDYQEAVKNDVMEYITNHYTTEEIKELTSCTYNKNKWIEELNDTLWIEDSVTGNASGSYTFNSYQAEENLCHNMELLQEALREFGCNIDYLEKGAEACDVTIRCYLLYQGIAKAIEEIEEDLED